MRESSLVSRQSGHRNNRTGQARVDIPNLLGRQFDVTTPNKVWCGDIIYVWTGEQWSYLAVVIDLGARRFVGWALSEKPDARLVIEALNRAVEIRGATPGLMFHSDQESQYASRKFRQMPWRHRIQQSMSRGDSCWGDDRSCCIIIFDDHGNIVRSTSFGTELYAEESCSIVEVGILPDVWHTVLAKQEKSIRLEVKKANLFR
jgi:hypothetical protein